MALTFSWNWTWIEGEKTSSDKVSTTSPSLTSRVLPARGAYDINKLNSIHKETLIDIGKMYSLFNTSIQPILDSLPAGNADTRWNLREEIDAFTYGVDGTTLFVLNDASSSIADGRYWHTSEERPVTISEFLEDLNGRISSLESGSSTTTSSSTFDDTDLWTAIGYGYNGGTSAAGSLDYRSSSLETNITHLANDVYGSSRAASGGKKAWSGWNWSQEEFDYSLKEYIDALISIHGLNPNADPYPWDAAHSGLGAHTHPQTEVEESTGTKNRALPAPDNLRDDMQRLRYEITYTRGTAWDSGTLVGPFVTNYPAVGNSEQTVHSHINFTGSGTPSATNPHGIDYTDTGADAALAVVYSFTGMSGALDGSPTYSSNNHIVDGDNLETAIGKLDAAISSTLTRQDYYVDRTANTEAWREVNPITISHGYGRKPMIQVIDLSPDTSDSYGMYSSWMFDVNIEHVSNNEFRIWTGLAYVQIIAIY